MYTSILSSAHVFPSRCNLYPGVSKRSQWDHLPCGLPRRMWFMIYYVGETNSTVVIWRKTSTCRKAFSSLLVSWIASLSLCGSCGLLGLTRLALVICWSLVLLSCTCHRCHQALRSGIWREKAKPCHKRLSILFPPCNSFLSLAPIHSFPKVFFSIHHFYPLWNAESDTEICSCPSIKCMTYISF